MMDERKVCEKCPNNPFCLVYKTYGEIHTSNDCINMTHFLRFGIPRDEDYVVLFSERWRNDE